MRTENWDKHIYIYTLSKNDTLGRGGSSVNTFFGSLATTVYGIRWKEGKKGKRRGETEIN